MLLSYCKYLAVPLTLLFQFSLFAQPSDTIAVKAAVNNLAVEAASLTVSNLQGIWKKADKRRYDLEGDEPYETEVEYNHILIEGNKIWEFEYPCQMFSVSTYVIEDSSIKIISKKDFKTSLGMVNKPTMFNWDKCDYGISADKKKLCFSGENYSKDSLNIDEINQLKNGAFNSGCLVGNWTLKTSYHSEYDGLGVIQIDYPWELPETITITTENVHWYYAPNLFYIRVDGVKRPFTIEALHLDYWKGVLVLKPYKWHKDMDANYEDSTNRIQTIIVKYTSERSN